MDDKMLTKESVKISLASTKFDNKYFNYVEKLRSNLYLNTGDVRIEFDAKDLSRSRINSL